MFFYLALRKTRPLSPKTPIPGFALNAPISCMNAAKKSATERPQRRPPACKIAAGMRPWNDGLVAFDTSKLAMRHTVNDGGNHVNVPLRCNGHAVG
ncbi:hypothetical protein [Shinella sp. HZN7]|uniref:hypothetical protein n=1 Tax=Shinella sp. (strain HZN7) TaxID=879274 RepID=UPI0011AB306F|nr:hypothetical protein [Shinella sp. HZN7]